MIDSDDYDISKELSVYNTSYIYGEIDNESIKLVFDQVFANGSKNECERGLYSFLDVGSGCGRLCEYLHNHFDFFVCGVEVDRQRFEKSLDKNANCDEFLEFLCDDFRNIYFGNYDILYCCNTVFSHEDNHALYKKIVREFKGMCFLLDYNSILLPYYKEKFVINTSWCNNVFLFLFML